MKIEEKLPTIFQGIDNIAGHTDASTTLRGAALDQITAYVEKARAGMIDEEKAAVDRMVGAVAGQVAANAAEQSKAEKAAALESARQAELHEAAQREADKPETKRK